MAFASLVLCGLCGCDTAARTKLRVTPSSAVDGGGAASVVSVAGTSLDAVVAIVHAVAERHGLTWYVTDEPGAVTHYSRRWDYSGDGHARTLDVTVSETEESPEVIEVTVFEWLTVGHSELGREVLDELLVRLRERFGAGAVSRLEPCGPEGQALLAAGSPRRR